MTLVLTEEDHVVMAEILEKTEAEVEDWAEMPILEGSRATLILIGLVLRGESVLE